MRPLAYSLAFKALIFSLAFLACGPEAISGRTIRLPSCISACGAELHGSTDCMGFDLAEARSLGSFGAPDLCLRLNGWRVYIDPGLTSIGYAGLTWVDLRVTHLSTDEWHVSAYSHELRHVKQAPFIDWNHSTWTPEDWAAIERAR